MSFIRTSSASPSCRSSLGDFGRWEPSQVAASASAARQCSRPPFRATSRDTDDAEWPILTAIVRENSPAAMPRDISFRSASERRRAARRRGRGRIPPVSARWRLTLAGPHRTDASFSGRRQPWRMHRDLWREGGIRHPTTSPTGVSAGLTSSRACGAPARRRERSPRRRRRRT